MPEPAGLSYYLVGLSIVGPVRRWLLRELSLLSRWPDSARSFRSESLGWMRWRGSWQRVSAGLHRPRLVCMGSGSPLRMAGPVLGERVEGSAWSAGAVVNPISPERKRAMTRGRRRAGMVQVIPDFWQASTCWNMCVDQASALVLRRLGRSSMPVYIISTGAPETRTQGTFVRTGPSALVPPV